MMRRSQMQNIKLVQEYSQHLCRIHLTPQELVRWSSKAALFKYILTFPPKTLPDIQRQAAAWWNKHKLPVVAVIGVKDPVIGKPGMIKLIHQFGGPCTIIEEPEAGHFVQEWGDKFTLRALMAFKSMAQLRNQAKSIVKETAEAVHPETPQAKL